MLKLKNAFTLTETVITIVIIGILMMGMTVYLEGGSEQSKIIEAEGCAATLDGEIQNYLFYALTSKRLKIGDTYVSPSSYFIHLSGGTQSPSSNGGTVVCVKSNYNAAGIYCDTLVLAYHPTWKIDKDILVRSELYNYNYKLLNSNNCGQNNDVKLIFHFEGQGKWGQGSFIAMNKGFAPSGNNNKKAFFYRTISNAGGEDLTTGGIAIIACLDNSCKDKGSRKEIGKREIDARSQTITLKKCKFYNENDPTLCETREK